MRTFNHGGQNLAEEGGAEVVDLAVAFPRQDCLLGIVGDIGVEDGVEEPRGLSRLDGENAVSLIVQKQSGTNTVEVVDGIKAMLPELRASLPASMTLAVRGDRAQPIRESVSDVKFTLLLTVALVVLVIFLFLRNLSATLIPSIALPISVIGTFAMMYVLGYSLDNVSLLGITLAVGLVVDDAIVMLENIVRHVEAHRDALVVVPYPLSPGEAWSDDLRRRIKWWTDFIRAGAWDATILGLVNRNWVGDLTVAVAAAPVPLRYT